MKVLWITNILFPDICEFLNVKTPVVGGWMHSSLNAIKEVDNNITFAVATVYNGNALLQKEINGVIYFCLPNKTGRPPINYDKTLEKYWIDINNQFKPDVVHIHGSEYQHGLAYLSSCGNNNVVLSIQGLTSVINRYVLGGINEEEWRKNRSFYNTVRMVNQRREILRTFRNRGEGELNYFKTLKYVIGRTSWDKAHAHALNPKIQYFFCNETLRSAFYKPKWNENNCVKHRIFLSQAGSPIKGLHQIIKALPLILRNFPNTEVYVAGGSPIHPDRKRRSTLGNYFLSLMKKTGTEDKFHFTGFLDEKAMVEMYLSSNVFVCPSSIENSPNSLGEAQILGVPCVSSYVGGVPDMIEHEKTGLIYRFEEYEMMAEHICRIFADSSFAKYLSNSSKMVALKRHDAETNAKQMSKIYNEITKQQ